jgi:hypothetical protein
MLAASMVDSSVRFQPSTLPEAARILGVSESTVRRLEEATSAEWLADEDLIVETIAAHLPSLAPAIRLVYAHILDDGVPDPSLVCCTALPTT